MSDWNELDDVKDKLRDVKKAIDRAYDALEIMQYQNSKLNESLRQIDSHVLNVLNIYRLRAASTPATYGQAFIIIILLSYIAYRLS